VVVVADEPNELGPEKLERLVAQYVLDQLRESGLQGLIEARQQLEAQMEGAATLEVSVGLEADGYVTKAQDVLVLRGAAPKLASDIEGRSPRDIKLALDLYVAILGTLTLLIAVWQTFHQQPPTLEQITQIFNQTTTVVHQTINMPPPSP
jgi:hypothetical protein